MKVSTAIAVLLPGYACASMAADHVTTTHPLRADSDLSTALAGATLAADAAARGQIGDQGGRAGRQRPGGRQQVGPGHRETVHVHVRDRTRHLRGGPDENRTPTNGDPQLPASPCRSRFQRPGGDGRQEGAGSSAEGTAGHPARTPSTMGWAACSTAPTETAIFPRLVDRLSWLLSPAMVPRNEATARSRSATRAANCSFAASARSPAAVCRFCRAVFTPATPTCAASRFRMALAAFWYSTAAEQSSGESGADDVAAEAATLDRGEDAGV